MDHYFVCDSHGVHRAQPIASDSHITVQLKRRACMLANHYNDGPSLEQCSHISAWWPVSLWQFWDTIIGETNALASCFNCIWSGYSGVLTARHQAESAVSQETGGNWLHIPTPPSGLAFLPECTAICCDVNDANLHRIKSDTERTWKETKWKKRGVTWMRTEKREWEQYGHI